MTPQDNPGGGDGEPAASSAAGGEVGEAEGEMFWQKFGRKIGGYPTSLKLAVSG